VPRTPIGRDWTPDGTWTSFDLTRIAQDAQDFAGAVFDGRYLYLVPFARTTVVRFDAKVPPSVPPFQLGTPLAVTYKGLMRAAVLLIPLVACGGTSRNAASSAPSSSAAPQRRGPIRVGERMTPIEGPLAIPVHGAKLTLVNYFATWCGSSKQWMPHVEAMRKKYASAGLAVVGVANYDDEATQAQLEDFVKQSGASFPVAYDKDRRIVSALPPSGWGQAIIVVDAQGIVRLVHRGTREGVFEEVDAQVGRLLGP
jgi:thiol-disulfide isomerase/thioredoxin